MSYLEAVRDALRSEMQRDPMTVLFGEDVHDPFGGVYKATLGLQSEFGSLRVRPTPISEAGFVGLATGAALTGLRPIVEVMLNDFLGLVLDQLCNHAAKYHYMTGGLAKVPMTLHTVAGIGRGFGAQHSQSLEAWLVHTPGLKVVMPSSPDDAKGLLTSAIRDDNPVVVFENSRLYYEKGDVTQGEHIIPLGRAAIKRGGRDVTIVATGRMVGEALTAAQALEREGIDTEVLDPRTLVPLDEDAIIASVSRTHRLVIAHDAVERGGFGAEIAALVAEKAIFSLDGPIVRVAAPNTPIPFSESLETAYVRSAEHVKDGVRRALNLV
ncbi:MAG: alpha-ketoacid dehydrogenase subunit beta [Chloroflexi bacterium]|nr:alpha-ketoacid dehydrogenase subunit beta [Chloroflexota bacterium]